MASDSETDSVNVKVSPCFKSTERVVQVTNEMTGLRLKTEILKVFNRPPDEDRRLYYVLEIKDGDQFQRPEKLSFLLAEKASVSEQSDTETASSATSAPAREVSNSFDVSKEPGFSDTLRRHFLSGIAQQYGENITNIFSNSFILQMWKAIEENDEAGQDQLCTEPIRDEFRNFLLTNKQKIQEEYGLFKIESELRSLQEFVSTGFTKLEKLITREPPSPVSVADD